MSLTRLALLVLVLAGCRDGGDPTPNDPVDDTGVPTDTDTGDPVDTDPPDDTGAPDDTGDPPPEPLPSGSAVRPASGGEALSTENYTLRVTVGDPTVHHVVQTDNHVLRVGIGAIRTR